MIQCNSSAPVRLSSSVSAVRREFRSPALRRPQNGSMRAPTPVSRILFRILASAGAGLLPAVFELAINAVSFEAALTDAAIGIAYAGAISSIAWTVLPRAVRRTLKLPRFTRWVTLILLISVIAAIGGLIAISAVVILRIIPVHLFWHVYFISLRIATGSTFIFSFAAIFQGILMGKLNRATAELKEKELTAERLRQAATEARLSSLESRIHPHFLFNTLNSISALIREDPTEAERMVERLAALLRFSLDSSGATLVPLSKELAIVRTYLEIERVRFGNRLSYRIEADPLLNSVEVPPLSVQTLVENSVKFAVSPRREGAEIIVRAAMRNGKHAIDVIDNGPGFALSDVKAGHGLDLLQSRLDAQFGSRSALEFGRDLDLTRVTVLL